MMIWIAMALAGDPCRGLGITEDAGATLGAPSWSVQELGFRMSVHDGEPFLTLYVAEPPSGDMLTQEARPFQLTFDSGTQMELYPAEGTGPTSAVGYLTGDQLVVGSVRIALRARLSSEAVHALAGARLTEVRYALTSEGRRVDADQRQAAKLQRAAACLANSVDP